MHGIPNWLGSDGFRYRSGNMRTTTWITDKSPPDKSPPDKSPPILSFLWWGRTKAHRRADKIPPNNRPGRTKPHLRIQHVQLYIYMQTMHVCTSSEHSIVSVSSCTYIHVLEVLLLTLQSSDNGTTRVKNNHNLYYM